MKMKVIAFLGLTLISCSNERSEKSKLDDVRDIRSMTVRADGLFDVVCRNGLAEVRSAEEIKQGNVCGTSSSPSNLVCVSRDNDGRDPWAVGRMDDTGRVSKVSNVIFSTNAECRDAINQSRALTSSSVVCASRDADGRSPYEVYRVTASSTAAKTALIFGDIASCNTSLLKARRTPSSLLTCASRDADGRNPWSLYAITETGVTKNTTVYSTFDDCIAQLP
jgi:hypothetical protein